MIIRLDTPDAITVRFSMLEEPRMVELERWRGGLVRDDRRVPHFDPLDGGDQAGLLVLLETPGPGVSPVRFVSRDNPTGTARNLGRYLDEAGIDRRDMVLWNSVPWIVHAPGARNRRLRRGEIEEGLLLLPGLLGRLSSLRIVLLAGRVAAQAAPAIAC